MDFSLSTEQMAFINMAQDFARDEIAPHASRWDKEHHFPENTLRKAASLGLSALYCPESDGGTGLTRTDAALIFASLAESCVSTTAYLSIHNMVAWMISEYGSDILKSTWLPDLISMQQFAAYALTEPNAGSDAASLKTHAKIQDDNIILNGAKAFISGGGRADVYCVMARTGEMGPKGISCFLVPKDAKGISFGQQEAKLGWHSQPTSQVFFEDCKIPRANLLGDMNAGFSMALSALDGGRVNIAACSLGGAKACLEAVKQYTHEREQFGRAIADFQTVQFQYADMLTDYEAAKLLVYQAANALDNNSSNKTLHCAMAKRFATDMGFQVSDKAMQLFGGYGYLQDYPIERFFRDLRVHQILEGTNEIMRIIIARRSLLEQVPGTY